MKLFAISLNQNHIPLYLFSAPAETLLRMVRLDHRSRDNRVALQRTLNRHRLKDIAAYISRPESLIANNIILNFDETVTFQPKQGGTNGNGGHLHIPDAGECATILDGQHRLMAFQLSERKDFELAVIGFLTLDPRQAADVFTIINTTQKPLQKSLLLDIRHYIGRTTGQERKATDIALHLNTHPKSPLRGQVKIARGEKGAVTLDALARMILPFIDLGGVLERSRQEPETVFREFLAVFLDLFDLPVSGPTVSVALSPVFERTVRRARNLGLDLDTDGIRRTLAPVSDFRWHAERLRNRAGRADLVREFLARLPEGDDQPLQEWLL